MYIFLLYTIKIDGLTRLFINFTYDIAEYTTFS